MIDRPEHPVATEVQDDPAHVADGAHHGTVPRGDDVDGDAHPEDGAPPGDVDPAGDVDLAASGPDPVAAEGALTEVVEEGLDLDVLPGGAQAAVEAVLMVADEPVGELALAAALVLPRERVRSILVDLAAQYDEQERGFDLREVAGGWRVFSRSAFAPVVHRFVLDGQTARLTQAALETLSVVAYRQPIGRARIAAIRGVSVDGVVRTLTTRGLIAEVGQDPETGAILYGTTAYFLERMGLGSLDELPPLAPHLPEVDDFEDIAEGHT